MGSKKQFNGIEINLSIMPKQGEQQWYALRVKARSEKWVEDRATSMNFEVYVPMCF